MNKKVTDCAELESTFCNEQETHKMILYLISSTGVGGSVAWLPRRMTGFLARLTSSIHFCT